jgi:N6-adenosine-specific RNA methylase IME4
MEVNPPEYSQGQPTMIPSEIHIEERIRKDLGDLRPFVKSIAETGLLQPILVTVKKRLVAGERRLEVWKYLHGDKPIPVTITSRYSRKAEIEENTIRKNLTFDEIGAVDDYYRPALEKKAQRRQEATQLKGKDKEGNPVFGTPNFGTPIGRVDDEIGKIAGKSGETIRKIRKIREAAKETPGRFDSLMENVNAGKTSVSYAYDVVSRAERHADPPELPEGVYDVVYADPPWNYYYKTRGNPEYHYSVMDGEEICELRVPSAGDAVLFLWATNPKLPEALKVVDSWGFKYKTCMVWVKDRIGTGFYVRGQHELLLIATKGSVPTPVNDTRPSSVLVAPRREHSRKPDEVYELIEAMYPGRQYLELFARGHRMGWTMWGDEASDGEAMQ